MMCWEGWDGEAAVSLVVPALPWKHIDTHHCHTLRIKTRNWVHRVCSSPCSPFYSKWNQEKYFTKWDCGYLPLRLCPRFCMSFFTSYQFIITAALSATTPQLLFNRGIYNNLLFECTLTWLWWISLTEKWVCLSNTKLRICPQMFG